MTTEINHRIRHEKNVENLVRNTLIGVFAPLGLIFVTKSARVIKSSMLIGGGVGIGMSLNGFLCSKSCNTAKSCHSNNTTKSCPSKNNNIIEGSNNNTEVKKECCSKSTTNATTTNTNTTPVETKSE